MRKETFLRKEWERITASGDYVWSEWRNSFERFHDDLIDMTPATCKGRFLAPKDKRLGYGLGNVEYHFPPVRTAVQVYGSKGAAAPTTRQSASKAAELAEKQEKRAKLADQFRKWERLRGNSAA